MSINYDLWPNPDGQLGKNKIEIPDGVTVTWPEGDALIGNFIYKDGLLSGFVDYKALVANDSKTSHIPYDYAKITLDKSLEGTMTFSSAKPEYFIINYVDTTNSGDSEVVYVRFEELSDEIKTLLRSATTIRDNVLYDENDNVIGEFDTRGLLTCHNMTFDDSGFIMDETTDGKPKDILFMGMDPEYNPREIKLVTFDSDLTSLENGLGMFTGCSNLTTFNSDLSSLTIGTEMFTMCENLTSFTSNLSRLTNGSWMFSQCYNLTSFSSVLTSLTDGDGMFHSCKLDASSVKNIIDTIMNTCILTLGMGCDETEKDKNLFAQEAGYADMTSLLAAFESKGLVVYAQYNGRPTTTYDLRRLSDDSLPIFVNLEEDEKYAGYISLDDSKKYRLNWFHETTGSTEGYTQFNSLEEAVEYFNIKPIERN